MEVLYNDENSALVARTINWKKHEVSSAEIAISSVKVPIALADRGSKWTFIVALTYEDAGKYITNYSERSPLVGLIKAPPVVALSDIDNDVNRSTSLEDSFSILATFEADSLDSIDAIHLVLYDDSDDLGKFRKIIFNKKELTEEFYLEGDDTTAYTPVKNLEGKYEVRLLIGKLDLNYTYEIAALTLYKMLFSGVSNTILFSPDKVPFLKKLVDRKIDIKVNFDYVNGNVAVEFNLFSPGIPAEDEQSEKLVFYVEKYPTAGRIEADKIGTAEISLLSEEKDFAFYDDNNKDEGNIISFDSINLLKNDSSQLVEIGEINYLRIFVENSYGKSKRYYDIEFLPIKKEAASVLQISEIVADSKAIKIRWTPPVISYNNEISTWKVTRSRDSTEAERLTNPSVLTEIIETIDVANTDENKENGDLVYTFNSLEVDKKFTFQVFSVITNQFNFDTWSIRLLGVSSQSPVTSTIIPGNKSIESFGVAYDTYQAPTVTADTTPVNSDGQSRLSVSVPTKPNFIQIDSIETDYTGSDGSSGTSSTTYSPNGTLVIISGLSNSVEYTFQVFVKASLTSEALSNTVPTQTNGTKSEPLTFRPWKRVAVELEFNGTDDSGSFGLKFLQQIITESGNTNVTNFITSNGTLRLAWRQPYSENEIKEGFKDFMPQQTLILSEANILPGFLTFVKATLSFPNLNDSTETISTDSYETVAVKSDAYTPSNLTFQAEPTIGDQGSTRIKWGNPVFENSNLFNSADNLNKNSLVGFELKRYSEEDLDFVSLPSTTGYRLLANISDVVSNRSIITPLNPVTLGGLAGPTEMTPAISALKYDGWYYKKTVSATSGSTSKIFWNFIPETSIKVSDLKQIFFKLKLINKTSAPFINVFTKKPNPNGPGYLDSGYLSRRTYDLININPVLASNALVNNEDYFCYVNFNGNTSVPVPDRHTTRLLRLSDSTANIGPFVSTEEIKSFAFSTNSAAAANTVEFIVRSLSLQSTGKTETYSFSNIISGVFDKDIDTTGKVYEFLYNYQAAELGKSRPFMVEAIYSNTIETRAPAIATTIAYKLPDPPTIVSVDSKDLKTLEIKITPPTQLGGGSIYGYLVTLVGTDKNGANVPTSDRTIVWQDLTDKTILTVTDLTSNVRYVASIRTLINLKNSSGDYIQSASSSPGSARYCLPSVAELEVKNFRVSQNGFNIDDTVVVNQSGASVELKWDSVVDGGYALDYRILIVDANGVQLPDTVETIVAASEATTTKVLSGLKFVTGLSYFSIIARVPNLNTDDATDLIVGATSSTSSRLYDTITEAVQSVSVLAGDRNVVVNWSLITQSTRGTNVAKYRVYSWLASGSISNIYSEVLSTVSTATISSLTNGSLYNFAVLYSLVEDPDTFFSPDNGYLIRSATPFAPPSASTIAADINVGIKQARITVTTESIANGSAVTKYNIYRKNITTNEATFTLIGSFSKVNGVLAYTDSNVTIKSTYDYFVKAVCKDTNNENDVEGPQSNTVRKIIFVSFATPSRALTFQAISESDFGINFKSLKDELAIASNSSANTGFVTNTVRTGLFGLIRVDVLDARLQLACSYLNGEQTVTVTKVYENSLLGNDTGFVKFSDIRGLALFTSGTVCTLTVSLLGKNPNTNQYVATDSVPIQFQPFGKATFNTFRTYNGIRNVAVKVISDPATTNYNFGVFSVFKCKVFVGYNGLFNNNGYSNFSSAELTSASGLFSYTIKDGDLGSSNPNRFFKFVITMETVGNFPSTNNQTSNEVNVIVSSEPSSNPDSIVVLPQSFFYSEDQTKAFVKVDTSFAPLVSLIVIFKLDSIVNSSITELYVDSRYPVTYNGVTYQIRDISSNPENLEDKLCGINTFEIPLVGFNSRKVVNFILFAVTTSGVSRPYFVGTKSGNSLAYGKSEIEYFPPNTDLSSIVRI